MKYQQAGRHCWAVVAGLSVLFVGALALPSLAADAKPAKPEVLVYKQTENAKGEAVELRLHVFKPEGWSADDQRPAAVFFFGGGWTGGKPRQFYAHCRDLAAMGMVTASAEYRVKGKHGTTPLACVEDGKSAVRYLRANAKSLGVDPGRVVAAGGSAGGHVAACTGILDGYEAKGEDRSISSVPDLMILFNPVIDTSPRDGYGAKKVPGDDPLIISPLHHVHEKQPPSLIFHGDADTTVKIGSIRAFDKRCDALGVACKLVEYKGAGHGFFNHASFRRPKADAPDYYGMTMCQAVSFLAKHGYVQAHAEPQAAPAVLLITDESLEQAWGTFADFKTRIGLPTKVVTVQSIKQQYQGKDTQAKIRACVLEHIEQHGTRYIILGGDSGPNGGGLVPDRDTPHRQMRYRDIPTDLYYLSPGEFDWDANDDGVYGYWPDDMDAVRYGHPSGASLGRIPVRTAGDIAAYTDKIIAYEMRYPGGEFANGIIYTNTVDGSEPKVRRSWDDYLGKAWKNGKAYRFFHTETAWDKKDKGDYALKTEHWRDRVNQKLAGKMHMHGHGMPDFWVLEDDGGATRCDASVVEQLNNEEAYLVMTTVSCFTGMYDAKGDPTIVETMLRTPKKGAVAVVCPSREGVPIFHNPQKDFRLMVQEGKLDGTTESMTRFWMNGLSPREDGSYRTIGEAFAQMKQEMAEHAVKTEGYHWCQCELNLLGDPTLSFRAAAPVDPKPIVACVSGFLIEGRKQVGVEIHTALRGEQGARLCLWQQDGGYIVVPIDADGNASASIPYRGEGKVTYTVAGPTVNAVSQTLVPADTTD